MRLPMRPARPASMRVFQPRSASYSRHTIIRHISSGVKTEPEQREWEVWNALERREEAEAVLLARFVRALEQHHSSGLPSESSPSGSVICELTEPVDVPWHPDTDISSLQVWEGDEPHEDQKHFDHMGVSRKVSSALHLPSPLTPEAVVGGAIFVPDSLLNRLCLFQTDMLSAFCAGGAQVGLHKRYVRQILTDAAALLASTPRVQRVPAPRPGSGDTVTVVGDLHGSISDLGKIIRHLGPPSPTHTYIFNGDFVDRGEFGLEVLLTGTFLHKLVVLIV